MTADAAGTLAGGRGKECLPPVHTAKARRVPWPQPDQVVSFMAPECDTADLAGHFSAWWTWDMSVVTGSGSRPLSPGWYGISGSSTEATWMRFTPGLTAQPGVGTPLTIA